MTPEADSFFKCQKQMANACTNLTGCTILTAMPQNYLALSFCAKPALSKFPLSWPTEK
jgi:hypothetical protein